MSSSRFVAMMVMNIFICQQADKRFSKDGKENTIKKFIKFIIFLIFLIGVNQAIFFFFQPPNLYQEIQISRKMPMGDIKNHSDNLKIKIMSVTKNSMSQKIKAIKRLQEITSILSHPARRLSYDTFGETGTEFAWAFKSQSFLISSIIGSSFFYVISIFINMMSRNKDETKKALKLQVMMIFFMFIWEIEVIMKTESRLHDPSDYFDYVYTSFPIFQRREMLKILSFPFTSILNFFLKYYVTSEGQKGFKILAKNPTLRNYTSDVRESLSKLKNSQHFQDRLQTALDEVKQKSPLPAQIYWLQRQALKKMFILNSHTILVDQDILQSLKYFHLYLQSPK